MILSEKLNLLFIKVPKTGSSSFELALATELEKSAIVTPIINEEIYSQWREVFPDFQPLWENRPLRLAHSTFLAIKQRGLGEFNRRLQSDLRGKKGPNTLGTDFWRFYNHISAKDVAIRIGAKKFSKLYKVAIVRHPFTRIISAYRYRLQKVDSYRSNPPSFEDWFRQEKSLFRPMTYFTHIKSENVLNQIIKYEDLNANIDVFCNQLGLSGLKLKNRFADTKIHFYSPPTTEELIGKFLKNPRIRGEVQNEYADDFVEFNYREEL